MKMEREEAAIPLRNSSDRGNGQLGADLRLVGDDVTLAHPLKVKAIAGASCYVFPIHNHPHS